MLLPDGGILFRIIKTFLGMRFFLRNNPFYGALFRFPRVFSFPSLLFLFVWFIVIVVILVCVYRGVYHVLFQGVFIFDIDIIIFMIIDNSFVVVVVVMVVILSLSLLSLLLLSLSM